MNVTILLALACLSIVGLAVSYLIDTERARQRDLDRKRRFEA